MTLIVKKDIDDYITDRHNDDITIRDKAYINLKSLFVEIEWLDIVQFMEMYKIENINHDQDKKSTIEVYPYGEIDLISIKIVLYYYYKLKPLSDYNCLNALFRERILLLSLFNNLNLCESDQKYISLCVYSNYIDYRLTMYERKS